MKRKLLGGLAALVGSVAAAGSASAQYYHYAPRVYYVRHYNPLMTIVEVILALLFIVILCRVVGAIFSSPVRRFNSGRRVGGTTRNQAYNQLARLQGQFNEMVARNYGITIRSVFYGPEVPFQATPYFSSAVGLLAEARGSFKAGNFAAALQVLGTLERTLLAADRYMYFSTFNSPLFLADPFAVSYANALGWRLDMEFAMWDSHIANRYYWTGDSLLFPIDMYGYDVVMAPGFDFVEVDQPDAYVIPGDYVVDSIPAPAGEIVEAGPAGAFDGDVVVDNGVGGVGGAQFEDNSVDKDGPVAGGNDGATWEDNSGGGGGATWEDNSGGGSSDC